MVKHMSKVGADSFAFYLRDPKGQARFEMAGADASAIGDGVLRVDGKVPVVSHASYTMNLSYPVETVRRYAYANFEKELELLSHIEDSFYNFHPGSHVGQGKKTGIRLIAEGLNEILDTEFAVRKEDPHVPIVLLETMPGKGSEIGGRFEELAAILDRLTHPERVGFCIDTCHLWDSGYDIAEDPQKVLDDWAHFIGFEKIYAIHLNDSIYECGAHMDTHQKIGKGKIGAEALKYFVQHPKLQNLPFILETPGGEQSHKKEIDMIREWASLAL